MSEACRLCGAVQPEVSDDTDGLCLECCVDEASERAENLVCNCCGELLEESSEDDLCDSCRIDQDNLDNGICPTCMSPIDDSGECVFCI